jgi:hypothetical protein
MESKKKYATPEIGVITLDNEISLALESNPPFGPGESLLLTPVNFNFNPLKLQTT